MNAMVRLLWRVTKSIFVTYAVVFSVGLTIVLVVAAVKVTAPIRRVKHLRDHNPRATIYMKQYLRQADEHDSLLHTFVSLDSISPHLIKAVLAAEDHGFYTHPGVDLNAILRAFEHNRQHNEIRHGASTISQQMAKNLFLGPQRTFDRKYRELIYTFLMERYLGKDRILELYLNYAQWGDSIFGCEAAARHYYRKSCRDLSLTQSCRLAAVLASPERLSPHYTESSFLQKRLTVIANNLGLQRSINDSTRAALGGTDSTSVSSDTDTTVTVAAGEDADEGDGVGTRTDTSGDGPPRPAAPLPTSAPLHQEGSPDP